MARSINKAIILGNLTRDPEMRYTPDGQAVNNFAVATNRRWTGKDGEQQEDTEFHDVVAWGKLAEICDQLLQKGSQVYIEGRLQTNSWEGKDGVNRQKTEIVASNMILLNRGKGTTGGGGGSYESESEKSEEKEEVIISPDEPTQQGGSSQDKNQDSKSKSKGKKGASDEEISEDEIPF